MHDFRKLQVSVLELRSVDASEPWQPLRGGGAIGEAASQPLTLLLHRRTAGMSSTGSGLAAASRAAKRVGFLVHSSTISPAPDHIVIEPVPITSSFLPITKPHKLLRSGDRGGEPIGSPFAKPGAAPTPSRSRPNYPAKRLLTFHRPARSHHSRSELRWICRTLYGARRRLVFITARAPFFCSLPCHETLSPRVCFFLVLLPSTQIVPRRILSVPAA